MKKIIMAFTATTFAAIAAFSNADAQNTKNAAGNASIIITEAPEATVSPVVTTASKEFKTVSAASINMHAIKDFAKSFKGVSNASWSKAVDGGFIATFMTGNTKNLVAYDSKGRWDHTILYYDEKSLPKDVRNEVKSTYYDFNIIAAEEVHVENEVVYLVHLQDDNTSKIIRVSDEGMDEIESLTRP